MYRNELSSLKIAYVYVGAVLGAGFASGRELLSFFGKYGYLGLVGLLVSFVLFTIFGIALFNIVYENKNVNYDTFITKIFGNFFGTFLNIVMNFFLFITFTAMIAGMGEVLSNLGISVRLGSFVFTVFIFCVFLFNTKGILKVNSIVCPIMIVLGILVGFILCRKINIVDAFNFSKIHIPFNKSITSAILYTSYNVFYLLPIIFGIRKEIKNRDIAIQGGICSGVLIFVFALLMLLPITSRYDILKDSSMPIIELLKDSQALKFSYIIVLFCAIFTTAIGNGFGLVESLFDYVNLKRFYISLFICVLGFIFSLIGFSTIVDKVYKIMGYVGIISMVYIIIYYFKIIVD